MPYVDRKTYLPGEGITAGLFWKAAGFWAESSALTGSVWAGSLSTSCSVDLNWIAAMYWIKVALKFMKLSFVHYRIKDICTVVNQSGFSLVAGCLLYKLHYSQNYLQFKPLFNKIILWCVFDSMLCANYCLDWSSSLPASSNCLTLNNFATVWCKCLLSIFWTSHSTFKTKHSLFFVCQQKLKVWLKKKKSIIIPNWFLYLSFNFHFCFLFS